MSEAISVTTEDLEALATKLEDREDLTEKDQHALAALFAMAHEGFSSEVEGFALNAYLPGDNMSLNFTMPAGQGQQGILIGLLKNGAPNGIIAVRKAGGNQQSF
jgi:hypothetical protein